MLIFQHYQDYTDIIQEVKCKCETIIRIRDAIDNERNSDMLRNTAQRVINDCVLIEQSLPNH